MYYGNYGLKFEMLVYRVISLFKCIINRGNIVDLYKIKIKLKKINEIIMY